MGPRRGPSCWRWRALFVAGACAAFVSPATASAQGVQAASTTDGSELIKTIPITTSAGADREVAYSITPKHLPALAPDDTLHTSAELQVSTTCVTVDPRCIGHRYSYSPVFSGQIVLSTSRKGVDGLPLTQRFEMGCGQKRPNRNHHCVLTLPSNVLQITSQDQLPCAPGACYLNLVVDAYNPQAQSGDVLVVGNDQPDGSVKGGRGRLNAIVTSPAAEAGALSFSSTTRVSKTIPLGAERSGFQTVAYSVRVDGLMPGDVISADARQITGISSLSLPAFVGDQIILAASPTAVNPKRSFSTANGQLDPANGSNCTLGPSPFQTPCSSYKAGQVTITQQPLDNQGLPKPLYVNLLTRSFLKTAQGKRGQTVRIRNGGYLNVVRYPAGA
jgi:hypothetical protein